MKRHDGCSLNAPQQPRKPTMKAMAPMTMKTMAAYKMNGSELLMSNTFWYLMTSG